MTRSSLHRCLQRHGISRLPDVDSDKPERRKFKSYPLGYFHIDIAEVRTEQGKLHLFVTIDRTSKFAFVELHEKATTRVSGNFLRHLIQAVPYTIHTVLTDNGIQFTTSGAGGSAVPEIRQAMADGEIFGAHSFELACAQNNIEHRTTKPKHPWTDGQVERMNRTTKDATIKRFYYQDHEQLRRHLDDFVSAYNFACRLKTLRGLTPYEFICKSWTTEPERFTLNPPQQMPGLNTVFRSIDRHGSIGVALCLFVNAMLNNGVLSVQPCIKILPPFLGIYVESYDGFDIGNPRVKLHASVPRDKCALQFF